MKRIVQAVAVATVAAASVVPLGTAANASRPAPQQVGPMGICPPGTCGPYGTKGGCEVNRAEVIAAGGHAPEECYYYGVVPDQGWYFYRFR